MPLTTRTAVRAGIPALLPMMRAAIGELQKGFLDEARIASSPAIMGLDNQLIETAPTTCGCDGLLAGCGGWSRRATLYGADHNPGRDSAMLHPARDPARVRAMYAGSPVAPQSQSGFAGVHRHSGSGVAA